MIGTNVDPSKWRRDPNRPYAFKFKWKMKVMGLIDAVGAFLFRRSAEPVRWNEVRRIAVLRLDHLGDVLLALPALKALEEALPKAGIDLVIGPWALDLASRAGLRATLKTFSASWFARGGRPEGTLESIRRLRILLDEGRYDAVIDLRGEFRHILAAYWAGVPCRIGLGRTGLGFLLTHPLVYKPGMHEADRDADLLEQAGIALRKGPAFPRLFPDDSDQQDQKAFRKGQGIERPVIALQATCTAASKRWPAAHWRELIERLPENNDVVLIGSEPEREGMEEVRRGCKRKVLLAAGSLGLPALAAFLRECVLFIGVDSGPAHIAAAVGTPVVSLYSGTNLAAQWAPRGPRVTVLQKVTPCSPCELTVCPIGNDCMNRIEVGEVLEAVRDVLG